MIGQLQDVGFVLLEILIGRRDAQIADDRGGSTSAFLGHFNYSIETYKSSLFYNNDYPNISGLHLTFLIV
jgi:hypothetical protein